MIGAVRTGFAIVTFVAALAAVLAPSSPLAAASIECTLARDGELRRGECTGVLEDAPVTLVLRPTPEGRPGWSGTLTVRGREAELEIVPYEYADGPEIVVRTPFGWYLPQEMSLEDDTPRLSWSTDEEAPPSRLDVEIVSHAEGLLAREERWDRADDRVCSPTDATYSLYCAMAEATRFVAGRYQHRQPALQAVRRTVTDLWAERVVNHRLMDFNNHPDTRHADVLKVLEVAKERLAASAR